MAHGFVQHDARPAWSKHYVHFPGWSRHRFEIDQCFAHGLVSSGLPGLRREKMGEALPSAVAVAAGFLPIALPNDHRDIYAHQRAHVTVAFPIPA